MNLDGITFQRAKTPAKLRFIIEKQWKKTIKYSRNMWIDITLGDNRGYDVSRY